VTAIGLHTIDRYSCRRIRSGQRAGYPGAGRADAEVIQEQQQSAREGWAATASPDQSLVRVRAARNPNEVIEEEASFGDRVSDGVARFGGSWAFIISFGVVLVVYTAINHTLKGRAWDPYPFILLNLFLSMLAAIQAPVIMMSQNRQDAKDRLRGELDFEVNRHSEFEIRGLARKLNLLGDKLDDVEELLRDGRTRP
jgi:uncharacterized membrane protein